MLAAEGPEPGNAIETDEVLVTSREFDAVFLATGTVVEQSPTPGTEAVAVTPVDIVVVSQDSVIVPKVEGLDLVEADEALTARNLEFGAEPLLDDDPSARSDPRIPTPGRSCRSTALSP